MKNPLPPLLALALYFAVASSHAAPLFTPEDAPRAYPAVLSMHIAPAVARKRAAKPQSTAMSHVGHDWITGVLPSNCRAVRPGSAHAPCVVV